MNNKYQKIIRKFIKFSENCEEFRAAVIIGSRARTDTPADDFSDLDIVIFSSNPEKHIDGTEWLSEIGEYHITFVETLHIGTGKERRVMFSDALDVDFVILPSQMAEEITQNKEVRNIFKKGMKVLFDKDTIFSQINFSSSEEEVLKTKILSEADFENLINDFWYHCIWSMKKILRGEFWTAKMCVDSYMKYILLKMIEIYTKFDNENTTPWHDGRFLEQRTKGEIIKLLENCFAHYNKKDIIHALRSTMNLFSVLARKNAANLGFTYSEKAEVFVWDWMKTIQI